MRIASLQPSVTLTLDALGRLDCLCGVTRYCLEALPSLRERGLPVLHDSWSASTAEIRAAKPDLAVASVPYRMESLAAILKSGVAVLALAPHTLADVFNDIRLLGSVTDAGGAAEMCVASFQASVTGTRTYTATAATRPQVYCEEWGKPMIRSQGWVAELVEAANGRFLGTAGAHTTPEEVAAADPDVLVFAWCGAGNRVPLQRVIARRRWEDLRAVRSGRVFCIPDEYLNTPAPTLLKGLECLAAVLHPELYAPHPEVIGLG